MQDKEKPMENELKGIKDKVDSHAIDIANLQNDYKHLSLGVSDLSVKVDKLSASLAHLDITISKATASFNTVGTILKLIVGLVALVSTSMGIYFGLGG